MLPFGNSKLFETDIKKIQEKIIENVQTVVISKKLLIFRLKVPSQTKQLGSLFKYIAYPRKWMFSNIFLSLAYSLPEFKDEKNVDRNLLLEKIRQICYCIENINLALYLDNQIEGLVQKIMSFFYRL